ncbi:MAG: hypothetical protein AMK73_01030 [Planctomycetes bacterium SM23_32]|nr:MAG: hypothetical protein AMK73_01030 [Planctomycetes bacterium SM23_32]
MRRVLFSVLVAVVGCMGAWFLLTNAVGGGAVQEVLSLTDAPAGTASHYTVQLLEFVPSGAKRAAAERMASQEALRGLAAGHEFRLLDSLDGRVSLCVGRFSDPESPEAAALLRRFRDYSEDGRALFAGARVRGVSK